jgi:hypothetical protein
MIDYGLAVSIVIAVGLPALLGNWWLLTGIDEPVDFLDVAVLPAFAGIAVGRLTTLALDDPNSIGSISDMLIIRSGVEFWPGVVAAIGGLLLSAHFGLVSPWRRLVEVVPLAMIGYASYEAACFFRDGCFGPGSPIGLRPSGLTTTMLPVGWFMAAAVALAAVGIHALITRRYRANIVLPTATFAVASVRSIGSIWLPHVGDGLTRQHITSIAVAFIAAIATARAIVRSTGMWPRSIGRVFVNRPSGPHDRNR